MDSDMTDFMIFLQKKTSELRSYGAEHGLSSEEIDACVDKALSSDESSDEHRSDRDIIQTRWKCVELMKTFLKIFLLLLVVISCVTLGIYSNKTSRLFYNKIYSSIRDVYSYDFNRLMRLLSLPLHNVFHIRAFYYEECLFPNPWFEPERYCELCSDMFTVGELKGPHLPIVRKYCQEQQPFVVRANKERKSVRFEDIVEMYQNNRVFLDQASTAFKSSDPNFSNLTHLFRLESDEELRKVEGLRTKWITCTMHSSRIIRKSLFPRPLFIPHNFEVSLQKTIFINGPTAQPLRIASGEFGMLAEVMLYVNIAKGKFKVNVIPLGACGNYCSELKVEMTEDDTIVFHQGLWKIDMLPLDDKETSIIFAGSFVP